MAIHWPPPVLFGHPAENHNLYGRCTAGLGAAGESVYKGARSDWLPLAPIWLIVIVGRWPPPAWYRRNNGTRRARPGVSKQHPRAYSRRRCRNNTCSQALACSRRNNGGRLSGQVSEQHLAALGPGCRNNLVLSVIGAVAGSSRELARTVGTTVLALQPGCRNNTQSDEQLWVQDR